MKGRVIGFFVLLVFMVLLLAGVQVLRFGSLTGYVIISDSSQADFGGGNYSGTEWNGTAVVLSSGQVNGNFTSRVFDAGADATWNNLSWVGSEPNIESLFCVDGSGAVYSSIDSGANWVQKTSGYGRTTVTTDMFSTQSNLYILAGSKNEIWNSTDGGVNWAVISSSFSTALLVGDSDDSGNLYVATAPGTFYKSNDNGLTWTEQGDINGVATNDPKGIADDSNGYVYAVDGTGDVYKSINEGVNWTKVNDGYGGSTGTDGMDEDSLNNLYILLNTGIYNSTDGGVNWGVLNDSITPYANTLVEILIDSNDNFFILDAVGRVFKSIDLGVSWSEVGDCNNVATNDPKGITDFTQSTNLSVQVRNCSSIDCADGTWQTADLSNLNLTSQYFQYKVDFTTPNSGISPGLNSVDIDYTLINTAPSISLVEPQNGATYGYNGSLSLNFSVSDADSNINSCWYTVDGGADVVITGCSNTSFNISEGDHTLVVYVNDTLGEEVNDSATFTIAVGAPTITLNSPINSYLSSGDVTFRYIPTDIDLSSCELWGDFTGTFEVNQTDNSLNSGIENTFSLTLGDGTYLWNVGCNDTVGNSATNGNKTFYIDTTNPSLSLTEPIGTKSSRTGIGLAFIVSDSSPVSCLYEVYRGASIEVTNTSVGCSSGSTAFGVTVDADFVLNFYVNDSAGNFNSSSTSFTVSTSSVEPPADDGSTSSGGSSGGGGSSYSSIIPVNPAIKNVVLGFSEIGDIVLRKGSSSDSILLEVTNKENRFLNKCSIKGNGVLSGWVKSSVEKGLGSGEKYGFSFSIDVPDTAPFGSYTDGILVKCDEGQAEKSFSLVVYRNSFESKFGEYKKDGGKLKINYQLEEYSGVEHNVVLGYKLVDFDGVVRKSGSDFVKLGARQVKDYILEFDLPKDSFGEFSLELKFSDGSVEFDDSLEIFLPSQGITGFSISDDGRRKLSIYGVIFVALVSFVLVFRVWYKRKKRRRLMHFFGRKIGRKTIKFEL